MMHKINKRCLDWINMIVNTPIQWKHTMVDNNVFEKLFSRQTSRKGRVLSNTGTLFKQNRVIIQTMVKNQTKE